MVDRPKQFWELYQGREPDDESPILTSKQIYALLFGRALLPFIENVTDRLIDLDDFAQELNLNLSRLSEPVLFVDGKFLN